MNRRVIPIVATFAFLAGSAAAQAQATQETQSPASAQTSQQNSPANPPAPQTPPKKVWTNEEMSSLDPHAGVSTVGNPNANSAKPGAKPHPNSKNHDPKWYQDQIVKLQAKIPPLDKQIAELQAAIDGKPTGDAVKSTRPAGVKFDNWTSELEDCRKKREDLLAQISALQDQARHAGVAPNALP